VTARIADRRAVTLANSGDNIGVYAPVLAATGIGALITYMMVFLLPGAVWCGRRLALRISTA